mgnify:CR=1 FL=1
MGEYILTLVSEETVEEDYLKAKEWITHNFPQFMPFVDEPKLEFVEGEYAWDIRHSPSERKIWVNMKRVGWHLYREQKSKLCPKYDMETALIHDLFEYCYMRLWEYSETDTVVISLVHHRARVLENALRREKGLGDWF